MLASDGSWWKIHLLTKASVALLAASLPWGVVGGTRNSTLLAIAFFGVAVVIGSIRASKWPRWLSALTWLLLYCSVVWSLIFMPTGLLLITLAGFPVLKRFRTPVVNRRILVTAFWYAALSSLIVVST